MKYFTKYLPVKGEIQPKDKVLIANNVYEFSHFDKSGCGAFFKESGVGFHGNLPEAKEWLSTKQKVKLFLCSRDIQVGDNTNEGVIIRKDGEDFIFKGQNGHDALTIGDLYKVIGGISSEAKWVQEGDEFEHEEVALNGIWQNWNSKTPLSGKNIVFIKCKCCNTFK